MSCTDPAAFERFEAKQRDKAVKYATAWVGAAAAQDVVQDGLLVVWQKWDTLTNPAGYLYRTCRQLAFGEYEDRSRGLALLAKLPERLHLGDDDQDEPTMNAAMTDLMLELSNQTWSSPRTAVVGLSLAEGHSRDEVAQLLGLPLIEVHRAARELRRYYKTRSTDPEPIGSRNVYTPHGLVMRAMRRLSRREREVMALAAIGLKPHLIAPLIGISGGCVRTTLCHARKIVIDTTGFLMDEGLAEVIDRFVEDSLSVTELLNMLSGAPWKAEALRQATFKSGGFDGSGPRSLRPGGHPGTAEAMAYLNNRHHGPRGAMYYLAEISRILTIVRNSVAAPEPMVVYGSIRWVHPGLRGRTWDHKLRMRVAAYRRLQATHAPYLEDPVQAGDKKTAANPSAYFCPVPCWPAEPPQYLTLAEPPALPPINLRIQGTSKAQKESYDRIMGSRLAAAA